MKFEEFIKIDWLHSIWQPCAERDVIVAATPEEFYEHIYQSPYEDWCVRDHDEARKFDSVVESGVRKAAEEAYLKAWSIYPSPEFCALLSDDVETIGSLILLNKGELRNFTRERLAWYARGRFPCGYEGQFEKGKWIIV